MRLSSSEKARRSRYRASRNLGVLGRLRTVHSSRRACVSYFTAWFPDGVWRVSSAANPLQASSDGSRCFAWSPGWVCIVGGLLLLLGLWTRATALVLLIQVAAAYFMSAAPRGLVPMRTGGEEVALYLILFSYFIVAGAGLWSLAYLFEEAAARCNGQSGGYRVRGQSLIPRSRRGRTAQPGAVRPYIEARGVRHCRD